MGQYQVSIFLTHCYVPAPVRVGTNILIEPFAAVGVSDIADLLDEYLVNVLRQPPQPNEHKRSMLNKIRSDGATVVLTISEVDAAAHIDAIKKTENTVMACRDILALRQLQRGIIAAFISMQTDVSPVQLYSHIRRPYPILRKVQNLPIGETEGEVLARLLEKAQKHPLLQVYLSLYADTVSYSDTLVTDVGLETRLLKTWTLLEAMASSERGNKKQKVKALFRRYLTSVDTDYHNHRGRDLVDIAYEWRNVIVHSGGCRTATAPQDTSFCATFRAEFADILEDLNQDCSAFIYGYAYSLS